MPTLKDNCRNILPFKCIWFSNTKLICCKHNYFEFSGFVLELVQFPYLLPQKYLTMLHIMTIVVQDCYALGLFIHVMVPCTKLLPELALSLLNEQHDPVYSEGFLGPGSTQSKAQTYILSVLSLLYCIRIWRWMHWMTKTFQSVPNWATLLIPSLNWSILNLVECHYFICNKHMVICRLKKKKRKIRGS